MSRRALMAIMVAVALLASACSAAPAAPAELALADAGPTSAAPVTSAPVTTTSTTSAPTTTTTIPPDPYRTWIATASPEMRWLSVLDGPDGDPLELPFVVPNPHQFGTDLTLMVTDGQRGDEWLQVQLPVRPNGQTGWIRAADYEITQTRVWAEVDLAAATVTVYEGEDIIAETLGVMGASATPTPLGTFYVAAKKRNSEAEYYLGPWALVLSGFSEALDTFSGGLPVIAIHGTHRPEQVGQYRSNGCIRVPNDVIEFLAEHVPLGAPVHVSA